jgi:hypothetical protein
MPPTPVTSLTAADIDRRISLENGHNKQVVCQWQMTKGIRQLLYGAFCAGRRPDRDDEARIGCRDEMYWHKLCNFYDGVETMKQGIRPKP